MGMHNKKIDYYGMVIPAIAYENRLYKTRADLVLVAIKILEEIRKAKYAFFKNLFIGVPIAAGLTYLFFNNIMNADMVIYYKSGLLAVIMFTVAVCSNILASAYFDFTKLKDYEKLIILLLKECNELLEIAEVDQKELESVDCGE